MVPPTGPEGKESMVLVHLIAASALVLGTLGVDHGPTGVSHWEVIDRIILRGNERTKDFVILRELRYEPGDELSEEMLSEGSNHLLNTGLFADVNYRLVQNEDPSFVAVELEVLERPSWYLLPSLDWDPDRGRDDWREGISVGLSGKNVNFRGEAQTLAGNACVGAEEAVELSWDTPWVGSTRTSLSLKAGWEETRDPFYAREETIARGGLGLTRWITEHHSVGLDAGIEDRHRRPNDGSSEEEEDALFFTPSVRFGYDSRDLRVSPSAGSLLELSATQSRDWATGDYASTTYALDARHFRRIWGPQTLAIGLTSKLSRGTMPEYLELRVGGVNTIRGWPQGVSQGIHSVVGTVEYRIPLVEKQQLPLPYFGLCDFSVASALFADAGMTWSQRPSQEHFLTGFGLGIRIFVPFADVIRLDYAWNSEFDGRWQIEKDVKL